jgi:hypothetical protein
MIGGWGPGVDLALVANLSDIKTVTQHVEERALRKSHPILCTLATALDSGQRTEKY